MKKLIIPVLSILLSSCAVVDFYQVYKTDVENGNITNNKIAFEDKNCIVSYNLWGVGGDIGFNMYNKTESDLTINLTKTFFVINSVAYEYFQNRTFTKSSNLGISLTTYNYPYYLFYNISEQKGSISSGVSTSYIEKPELTIPSKTSINISWYRIANSRYFNCELSDKPQEKGVTLKFDKSNSPFVFSNQITYIVKRDTSRFINNFYVSEITNLPSNYMFIYVYADKCGKKFGYNQQVRVFKNGTPDKFYINYNYSY